MAATLKGLDRTFEFLTVTRHQRYFEMIFNHCKTMHYEKRNIDGLTAINGVAA